MSFARFVAWFNLTTAIELRRRADQPEAVLGGGYILIASAESVTAYGAVPGGGGYILLAGAESVTIYGAVLGRFLKRFIVST